MGQEDLYADAEKVLTLNKIDHCTWPIQGKSREKFLKVREDGSIEFNSTDNTASIRLLDNGVIFEIEYLQLLNQKKPIWVNRSHFEDNTDNKVSSTMELIRDIASKRSKKENPNVLKLGFEYIKVKKRFSILNFPACWAFPLSVVIQKFEELWNNKGFSLRLQPAYPQQFLFFLDSFKGNTLDNFEEINLELSPLGILILTPDSIMNELPLAQTINEQESKLVSSNNIWQKDNVNPTSDFYRNESKLHHQFVENFVVWLTPNYEVLIWVQADNSLILSSNEGGFYTHFYKNVKETLEQSQGWFGYENKFSKDTVALITRSKRDSSTYKLQEVVADSVRIIKKAKLSIIETKEEAEIVNDEIQANSHFRTLPFEPVDQRQNEIGSFEAYKNRSVKVIFKDRTVLRINFGEDVANILTKFGDQVSVRVDNAKEFEYYTRIALDYYYDIFTDSQTKMERQQEEAYRNDMINYELEKNSRFLNIVSHTLPKSGAMQYTFQENPWDKENEMRNFVTPQKNSSAFDMDDMARRIEE